MPKNMSLRSINSFLCEDIARQQLYNNFIAPLKHKPTRIENTTRIHCVVFFTVAKCQPFDMKAIFYMLLIYYLKNSVQFNRLKPQ